MLLQNKTFISWGKQSTKEKYISLEDVKDTEFINMWAPGRLNGDGNS